MKIAVIGGGISGLGAGVILSPHHEVHLFESAGRLGGHANTVDIPEGAAHVAVDTGFLVYNELNYPHLTAFFRFLNVETVNSDMSLSVRSVREDLEWAGTNLNTIFAQRRNLFRPSFLGLLKEILRFHRHAEKNLSVSRRHGLSLGELLVRENYSQPFCQFYLLPIGAAIWSTPEAGILDYPADTFLTFFLNHKLLQMNNRPVWRTVLGGSRNYVKKAQAKISNVHLNAKVTAVKRSEGRVWLRTENGEAQFDKVIFATHAPVTLQLLQNPNELEKAVLGAFQVEKNKGTLHRDPAGMPRNARTWAAWNVMAGSGDKVSLTYHLNRLQPLPTTSQYFLTLNPTAALNPVLAEFAYDHPRFTREAVRAQSELSKIQGQGGIHYAGAWTRYGFHEDGLLSAVNVAKALGAEPPWDLA